jgi:hypothetical protein
VDKIIHTLYVHVTSLASSRVRRQAYRLQRVPAGHTFAAKHKPGLSARFAGKGRGGVFYHSLGVSERAFSGGDSLYLIIRRSFTFGSLFCGSISYLFAPLHAFYLLVGTPTHTTQDICGLLRPKLTPSTPAHALLLMPMCHNFECQTARKGSRPQEDVAFSRGTRRYHPYETKDLAAMNGRL